MRGIAKGAEPASLTAHRQTDHCDYDNYADKAALRHALVTEQRGLCCYCMGRIHDGPNTMKIEHWKCQSRYGAEQLSYRNLLGACLGGNGQPPNLQHCDTRKGDLDLEWNPADPAHHIETRLRYEVDGSIGSGEPAFHGQLSEVLKLNVPRLKNNRQSVLTAVPDWWKQEKARVQGPVSRARFERERRQRVDECQPYCQVAVWWLDQRLASM